MFPRLFTYESFALPTYGVLVALGFVAGLAVAVRLAGREGFDKDRIFNLGVYLALTGMIGAKIFLVAQDWDYYSANPRQIFSFSTLQSGGIFFGGLLTVAQFSFWGNYLPRVYPTHLRGTGESFAANIGGRMVGTSAALLTTQFAKLMPGGSPATNLAYAAAAVAFCVYAIGFISSFWLPEPKRQELPE